MPPKAIITKEMILNKALELTRETGFETVNARSIASKLQCSARPIFTCYKNMDKLKCEFLDFAYAYYERYVAHYSISANVSPALILPLSYIDFAREETHLFKLLFINDMDLEMAEAMDFYNEIDNETRARTFFGNHWRRVGTRENHIFGFIFLYAWDCSLNCSRKNSI